ncbi:MAG: signal recognition particle-docking protein FtsY [bacterium]
MKEKKNILNRLKGSLAKTKHKLLGNLEKIIPKKGKIDEVAIEEIEEALILADVGTATTSKIIQGIVESNRKQNLKESSDLLKCVKKEVITILSKNKGSMEIPSGIPAPYVVMMLGVNGVGKTTTIAKLANVFKEKDKKLLLAAGDTFRAAAIEQLLVWGERLGVDIVRHKHGADPSAVVFDAVEAAKARSVDILLIDTAGRQYTKTNLMEELKKMERVITKTIGNMPYERLLVIDSTTGQNSIQQVEQFNNAIEVTGIIITKLDGTAKGGSIISIADKFNIPIKMLAMGEGLEDIYDFDPEEFTDALFSTDEG